MATTSQLIREGESVIITGGGSKRIAEVRNNVKIRLGRSGVVDVGSLVGMRYGEVVSIDTGAKRFVATSAYPDLDLSEVQPHDEEIKDNRNLRDDNSSQQLTNDEVAAIRAEKGLDHLLSTLVENSATFQNKTGFSQEKYIRKKQKKYGVYFKIEMPTAEGIAEVHLPTINPSDSNPEESRCVRLRADTVALILHHSNVHSGSRVLAYDRTNGALEAYFLTRLGDNGRLFQLLDKTSQPNNFMAMRVMQLPFVKERWKAVPRNAGFLEGKEESTLNTAANVGSSSSSSGACDEDNSRTDGKAERPVAGVSQWMKGLEAREALLAEPADSLVIADDEAPEKALIDLFPFLAYGGHIVVYSPFLEDLTGLFVRLRNDCVNIRISETWYRHQQVLPQRTHPTVNMNTGGGYLLTAIKVERNPSPRPRFAALASIAVEKDDPLARKRGREDGEDGGGSPEGEPPRKVLNATSTPI